ncbi:MAG: hypothetical protein ABSE40_04975 [Candidatus Sulfotelmatobacter sp.]|jgi:hypothetical protein
MSQPHIQLRNALLDDHVAKGWMDGDMFLAYSLMLRRCDWSTGIWHGSAASLAALSGGQWSLATAKRILKRLCLGRYLTSHHVPKEMGNYDLAINNYVPTSGENKSKKLRRTKTQDHRLRLANEGFSHEPLDAPKGVTTEPLAGSPVSRIQDLHSGPPASGGVGSDEQSESASGVRPPRIADAIAGASPCRREPSLRSKTKNQPQPEVEVKVSETDEVPVPENEVPPVSEEDPSPVPQPPSPELEAAFMSNLQHESNWLANYLWAFIQARPDVEILRPWEKFWVADFDKALSDGYSKEDIELAILCSQAGKARELYKRALSICNQLDLLIEKGRKLRDKGVLREHACKCGALFAMLEDLQEHQETCETALAIDPEDAAEEEAMYAAEDLIGYGEVPDPLPDFDPFADTREGENWQ